MRILYSCLSRSWGGMEMYTLTSLKQLLKKNIYVELLCIEGSRIHIEANGLGLIINTMKSAGYFSPAGITRIASIIRKRNFDLIHSHYSRDLWQIVPALELIKSNIPLILTKHLGSFVNKKDKLHRWIYNRVSAVIAISSVISDNLAATCPVSPEKITIIYNGIDTDRFIPDTARRELARKELGIEADEILIGMIARFSPGKGHEEFLNAAAGLNTKFNNLKYVIVGEASRGEKEYADSIQNLSNGLGIKNIIFTGYRSDTEKILNAFDIFVFPSHAEAFGIALIEAMASGIPTVCADSDGVLDIAIDNTTSFLFKTKDHADLQRKAEMLIESPELRHKFGKAARERVINHFNIDNITTKTLKFYKEIIN